ncbi:MAG: glycosyltransferase family 2 protein [Thiotrichaceae bacterium]|nr:glycosyltransferase family 2 protein [Thiotrichaceae bacterium]PCI13952.1 MAG: hypothetical protein COB71_04625 [Thiotrichales bacterium]
MSEPKITVIIPTRERGDVLEKSLLTVTAQDYNNLDIIVSDNFSSDNTEDVVRSANDARVKYFNTGKRLSMSHNWEFALSNVADDGWVTIIGDDDGLLPGSLKKIAEIIKSTDVQAIRTSVCSYAWPSLTGKQFGRLGVPLKSGHEIRKSKLWLSKVLSGDSKYTELPMLYNGGFVNMSVLKQLKSKTGSVYRSCIPDVYSAVAISSIIDRYIYSHEPLAINGASRHSTGTSQFATKDKSELSPADRFASEGNIPFHKDLPLCADGSYPKSLQAMVYESYLQSRCLRGGAKESIHAEQLEVILETSGKHDFAIGEWGEEFARKHGLDYDVILAKASRKKTVLGVVSIPSRISRAMNIYSVGSPEEPIKDIYEAAMAAAVIRDNMPGRIKQLRRLFERAVKKVLK